MITVHFACGHSESRDNSVTFVVAPRCTVCGERRIRDVDAPAPTFRGAALGPCAVPTDATPFSGKLKE